MFLKNKKSIFFLIIIILICVSLESAVFAEKYPSNPIKIIVPWGAGGGNDLGARLLLPFLEKHSGGNFAVINLPGASGEVGLTELKRSNPDGYTIGMMTTPVGILGPMVRNTAYKYTDFTYLWMQQDDPNCLQVPSSKPWKTFDEFLEYAKKNTVAVGAGGGGTESILLWNLLAQETGIKHRPVFFPESASTEQAALAGGHIDACLQKLGESASIIRSGKSRPLAVALENRHPDYPDLPTFKELGYPNTVGFSAFRGFVAPRGIPEDIRNQLIEIFRKATSDPEYTKKMLNAGMMIRNLPGDEYLKTIQEQEKLFKGIVDLVGIEALLAR